MQEIKEENTFEPDNIEIAYQPDGIVLWSDITGIIPVIHSCFEKLSAVQRKSQIAKILATKDWYCHYQDKVNGRRVLSETELIEHQHELTTAILLSQVDYDVIFAPKAMFIREEKKFDVFLVRDTIILKADLKCITSKNPDTIAKRIKGGSDQASRVVIHINSDIEKKVLINSLRSGVERNSLLKEILLFYKKGFYRLPKNLILSREIIKVFK
jgi:hypothetical protein